MIFSKIIEHVDFDQFRHFIYSDTLDKQENDFAAAIKIIDM